MADPPRAAFLSRFRKARSVSDKKLGRVQVSLTFS